MTSTSRNMAIGQVVAVGVLAAVAAPCLVGLVAIALLGGPIPVLIGLPLLLALLYGLGALTLQGSPLTVSVGRRLVWTAMVFLAGTTLAVLGYAALRDIDVDPGSSSLLGAGLAALVFMLVAGVFTGRRAVALPAGAVLLALTVVIATLVVRDQPNDDLAERLAAFETEPDLVFVTAVPGYGAGRPSQPNVAGPFTMTYAKRDDDPATEIYLSATRGGSYSCEVEPPGGFPEDYDVRCYQEGPGRWYERAPEQHSYLVSRGDRLVEVSASTKVERSTLREAVDNARQVLAAELADVVPAVPE